MEVFEKTSLAGMSLKNRIIRAATYEGMGDERGLPRRELADLYIKLAQGGAGAIITGYAGVLPAGKACSHMLMVDREECVPALREVTQAVKPYQVPLILQIAHGGGMTDPAVTGNKSLAPSRRRYKNGHCMAQELTENGIREIIAGFVRSIRWAQQAGFDGVELHAAHGYLLAEFLSPYLNQRRDAWGGTTEKRCRIIREIITQARESVGAYPILIKFSAHDRKKNGMCLEESVRLAQLFQAASCDALEVSCGNDDWFYTIRTPAIPLEAILAMEPSLRHASRLKRRAAAWVIPHLFKTTTPLENYNVTAAAKIKAAVDIPVIVVGGICRLASIAEIIAQNQADYVSLCRPFIIEPNIVHKMQAGIKTHSSCLHCNYCLIGVEHRPLRCYFGRIPQEVR